MIKDLKSKFTHSPIHVNPLSAMWCAQHYKTFNIIENVYRRENALSILTLYFMVLIIQWLLMDLSWIYIIFINIRSKFPKLAMWTKSVGKVRKNLLVVLFAIVFNSWKEEQLGFKDHNQKSLECNGNGCIEDQKHHSKKTNWI